VDENLDGRNDFITEKTILIMSGDAQYEDRGALSFVNSHPATITVASAFKDSAGNPAQIKAGTIFRVLNISSVEIDVVAIKTQTDPKVMGRLQIVHTTIDLNQAEGTYDLFTGTTQDVVVEKLVIRMPNAAAGGALTSISIQTDDTTPQVFISSTNGAIANLTAEAQLAWTGAILIDAGTEAKIQLTIAGGAHGSEYICDVIAEYRAVVSGGYLA
ncbi:unnamed protein product, partial [marine sediment metagenome]